MAPQREKQLRPAVSSSSSSQGSCFYLPRCLLVGSGTAARHYASPATNVNSPTVTPAHMLIGWGLSRSQIRRGVAVVLEKALQTRAVLAERSECWFKGKDPRPRHPLLPVNPQQVLAHLQRHTESLACHIFIAMDLAPKVDLVQSTWQIQAPLNACACILEHHSEKHQVRLGKGQP